MEKISVYICDDNAEFADKVRNRTESVLNGRVEYDIIMFNKGDALIQYCEKEFPDIALLDIDMPSMSGFEIAQQLRKINKNAIIIFITSHEDKVFQSWVFQPFWFVRKSHFEDLDIAFLQLLPKIEAEREKDGYKIGLNVENRIIEVDITQIKYIQSYRHYVLIKYANADELKLRCKISDIEKQLHPLYFVRIQNGVVANCRFISKITSREVILLDDEKIHINRQRLENVKNEFQAFMRSRR